VKSAHQAEWLQAPMMAINRWRMPLLFLLSGLAVGLFQPARDPWRFLKDRTVRLLLPLAFGMAVIIPVQAYCQGVSNGSVAPGFPAFLMDYFTFRPWPAGAFDGSEVGITWNHLWYLPYLWVYTLLLGGLLPLLESRAGKAVMVRVASLAWPAKLLLLASWIWGAMVLLARDWPQANNLFADWYQHAVFFVVFLSGYAMARGGSDPDRLARARRPLLVVAVALGLIHVAFAMAAPDGLQGLTLALLRMSRALYTAAAMLAALAWARALLNRPWGWLPYASEAVFPWYILHQSFNVLLVFVLAPMDLGPVAEPMLVLLGTVGGCALLHHAAIRRSRILRPLFGLKPPRRVPHAPASAALSRS
jgi:peptidoglycan/LPS O-acetylase OafA/YrhL